MRLYLFIIFLIIPVITISHAAAGEWSIYKRIQIRNENMDVLRLDSSQNDIVRVWLILGTEQEGAFLNRSVIYRVDEHKIHDLRHATNISVDKSKSMWLRWIISEEGLKGNDLRELTKGKMIVFQYYLPDGEIKETAFILDGLMKAVREITK